MYLRGPHAGLRHSGGDVLDEQHSDCGVPAVGLSITGGEPLARALTHFA